MYLNGKKMGKYHYMGKACWEWTNGHNFMFILSVYAPGLYTRTCMKMFKHIPGLR